MKSGIWMLGALVSFALMAIAVKELGAEFSLFEMLFFRSVIGLMLLSLIIYVLQKKHPSPLPSQFKTKNINKHALRNVLHFAGQWCWMFGIVSLPLAQVFALEFTTPIWTLLIASLFFDERLTRQKIVAVTLGFIGVLLITQPSSEWFNPVSLIVLLCGVFYGFSLNITKTMVSTESPLTILFYMSVIQLPIGFIGMLNNFALPSALQMLWLLCIAFTALVAHFCISKAMLYGAVSQVITVDFIRLPIIMLIGAVVYHENLEATVILGGVIIFIGNVINVVGLRYFSKKG